MMDRKTARAMAAKLVARTDGLLGRRPLQAVVREHRGFLDDLRASGASWSQIAALLHGVGLKSADGGPVGADALRAMMSRASKKKVLCTDIASARRQPCVERGRDGATTSFVSRMDVGSSTSTKSAPIVSDRPYASSATVAERMRRAASLRVQLNQEDGQ